MSRFQKGHKPPWTGGHLSAEHRQRISDGLRQANLSRQGSSNSRWQGGQWTRADGVAFVWVGNGQRPKRRSRMVAEEALGRELLTSEIVHHLNEDRSDDWWENFAVVNKKEHQITHRAVQNIRWLARNRPDLLETIDIALREVQGG